MSGSRGLTAEGRHPAPHPVEGGGAYFTLGCCCCRKPEMLLYIRDTFGTDATEGHIVTEEEAPPEDGALAEAIVQAFFQHGNLRCDVIRPVRRGRPPSTPSNVVLIPGGCP